MSAQAATAETFNSSLIGGMAIHTKLDELLEERQKSLYWLQKETGISYTALLKLRKDRARSMDYAVLDKICAALDCEPGDLIVRVPGESKARRKG
jgi:putative transcriptional regulator